MKYLMLRSAERRALLAELAAMPEFLAARFGSLPADAARTPGPDGAFSPVEQCWHLADLEREGFGVRITRLRGEANPALPDFDGARIAAERHYRTRSLSEAVAAFRDARRTNLEVLGSLRAEEWSRSGEQEGVGKVALCDLPHMMAEHDRAHRAEIEAWSQAQ
jgi:hypothetical protein